MKNLLLTYVGGEGFIEREDFRVFLRSAHLTMPGVDKIVCHHHAYDIHQIDWVEKEFGVEFMKCPTPHGKNVLLDRWGAYHHATSGIRLYKHVAIADARDIVFQDNPFKHEEARIEAEYKYLVVCSEGMKHRQSEWNLIDQFKYQMPFGEYQSDFKDWDVFNAGFVMGTPASISELSMLMWQGYVGRQGVSDQAVFNHLINGRYGLVSSLIYHRPSHSQLCLTGEGVDRGYVKAKIGADGIVYDPESGKRYCVFHQWDRTDGKQTILDKYKN